MIIPKLRSAFICLWGIPVKTVTLGMWGGWYLFNFMVFFSLANDKRWPGLQQEPNPICLIHTTSHTDYSGTVCGRDLSWTLTVSIIFLYKQVFLFVLRSSQTVTHMLPDEMCDRRQQICESSKKREHQISVFRLKTKKNPKPWQNKTSSNFRELVKEDLCRTVQTIPVLFVP